MCTRTAAKALLFGVLLLGLAALGSRSARAGGPPHDHEALDRWITSQAEQLGLDAKTLAAIRTIAETTQQNNAALRQERHQAHQQMRTLLSQDTPDEAAVMHQAEVIGNLEVAQRQNRLRALLQIRVLLTPAQRQELMRLHTEQRAGRRTEFLQACQEDLDTFCADVPTGRGSKLRCLRRHRADLSDACHATMPFRGRSPR